MNADAQEPESVDRQRLTAKQVSLTSAGITPDTDEPFTIELGTPIDFGKETITELTFQPMQAKHMRAMPAENAKLGDLFNLAGRLCGHPPRVMDELSAWDLARVNELVALFMEPFQGTG